MNIRSPRYVISADIGTSYVKAGLYDKEGNCKGTIKQKALFRYLEDGALEQQGDDFVNIFINTVKSLIKKTNPPKESIEAISFTGQMAGVIGIDKNWNASTVWSGTMDNRQNSITSNKIDSEKVLRLSGTNFPFMANKIRWFEKDNRHVFGNILKFVGLSSYVIGKIADLKPDDAFLESTYLTWTGIADIKNRNWSEELCCMFGIDRKKLPNIVASTAIVGRLSKSAASACGLLEGTPIIAGAGDKIAGCVGAGAVEPGMIVEECASVAAMSLCVDSYNPDIKHKTLETLPSVIPGQYYSVFFIAGSGLAMDWFIDNFAEEEKKSATYNKTTAFKLLDEKAEKIAAGSENLICIGLLGGRALPFQPYVRGAWIGHSFLHTNVHFYRALLESYAYEYKNCLDIMKKQFNSLEFSYVRVIGGGSSSKLWNEIKTNVLAMPYEQMDRSDLALLGTAIIGGAGVGIFDDIKTASKKFAKVKKMFKVENEQSEKYAQMSSLYKRFVEDNKGIFDELNKGRLKDET